MVVLDFGLVVVVVVDADDVVADADDLGSVVVVVDARAVRGGRRPGKASTCRRRIVVVVVEDFVVDWSSIPWPSSSWSSTWRRASIPWSSCSWSASSWPLSSTSWPSGRWGRRWPGPRRGPGSGRRAAGADRRRTGRRGDPLQPQGVLHDPGEDRRRHLTAVDRGRLVEHDHRRQPGLLARGEPHEAGHVVAGVAPGPLQRLAGGPGLAGGQVAGDGGVGARPRLDDLGQHRRQLPGRLGRDDPAGLLRRRPGGGRRRRRWSPRPAGAACTSRRWPRSRRPGASGGR